MAHLVAMSLDEFQSLPQRVVPRTIRMRDASLTSQDALDWIFIGYCEKLIEKNGPLVDLLNLHRQELDDHAFVSQTTKGQRLLLHLAALDGHTLNGGIAQFIWNCPQMVLTTADALKPLNYPELVTSYEKVVDRLGIEPDAWGQLRHVNDAGSNEIWDNLTVAGRLIRGDEFDNPYFDHVGATARRRAIKYVHAHTHEFITPHE